MSVIGVRKICDEKSLASDCGSEKARGLTRLENRETCGTRLSAARMNEVCAALRFSLGCDSN
jgi:hypothetical protein